MKFLSVFLCGTIMAVSAAFFPLLSYAEEEICPPEANQIIYDAKRTLDTKNAQSVREGWQYSNAVIQKCPDNFYALITAAETLYLISNWVNLDDAYAAASMGWEAAMLAASQEAPETVPQVKRPDGNLVGMSHAGLLNPAIERLAMNLVLLSGGQSPLAFPKKLTHDIFNPIAHPVNSCPYALDDQKGAEAEANGLLKGAVESGTRNAEFMTTGYKNANTRLATLQEVCGSRARYIAETRAELYLKFAGDYDAKGDSGNALGMLQTARQLLDDSYEMTSEGRPYSTIEKLHNEINEKLEQVKAKVSTSTQ